VTPLNKSSDPLIAPQFLPADANSIMSCSFIWSPETYPFFVGNSADPFSSLGFLLTTCLITMVALSYLPALALNPVLERLLFTR
jgi:hypothetical protein